MEENETVADRLDRFANTLEDVKDMLRYPRPLIRIPKHVWLGFFIISDVTFKLFVIIKLWP